MRRLPPLTAERNRWVLPMSDRSAVVLADLLICGGEQQVDRLAEQLAADPPLLLWAVCLPDWENARPRSVGEVARWLATRLLEVLQWDAEGDGPSGSLNAGSLSSVEDDGLRAEQCGQWVAEALAVADLVALLAAGQSPPLLDEALLLALLGDARRWLAASGDAAGGCLPDWLGGDGTGSAGELVAQAIAILGGTSDAGSMGVAVSDIAVSDIDVEQSRHRADRGRRRWLKSLPGAGIRIAELTARLARLEELENRFEATLEHEKLAAMAEFAAGAGHEINNPLAVIAGRAQLFLQDEADPERRRGLALMNAQAKRVYEMIADMRLFARPPRPTPEMVELVVLIDGVVEEYATQAAERGVTVRRADVTGSSTIEADPLQLGIALRAMCKNSLESIGHEGLIEIGLRGLEDEVEIYVRDDGPGFADEVRRHLFDPFYSARQAGRGLGLGLSKCWRIVVTNHGGRIESESQPGQGATFTITLPRRQVTAESL